MTAVLKAAITRRPFVAGLFAALGIAAAGLAAYEAPAWFRQRRAPTALDDLLDQLPERDSAARLGAAYLAGDTDFDSTRAARELRRRLAGRDLATAVASDAERNRMAEADGWVVPETLAMLCALAAKAAGSPV